ncbi:MAG: tetratricopeptide repeat protein [Thermoflexibacter sp.]|nr:tetratricopeptide repeat protein [Thermoflexibacter sp.]
MRFLFLLIILLVPQFILAQQGRNVVDSLLNILPSLKKDTNKVNTLNSLSYALANTDPERSRNYATEAISLAKKMNYNHGYASGIELVGTYYERLGDYAKALEYKLQSLRIHEQSKDIGGIGRDLNNIGVLYYRQKNYEKALEYYEKAFQVAKRQNKPSAEAAYLLNIGEVYQEKGEYAKAIEYEQKSMEISQKLPNMEDYIAFALGIIGQCYSAQGQYDKALVNMKQTIQIFEKIDDKVSLAEYLIDIGNVYLTIRQYSDASQSFNRAIQVALQIGDSNWLRDAHLGLASTYFAQKNFEKAYIHQTKYDSLKDIVFNENSAKRIAQMQTLYEADKRNAEIEILKKDKKIQQEENRIVWLFSYSLLGTFMFLGGVAFVLYRNNLNKQKVNRLLMTKNNEIEIKNAELEQQKEEILTQRDLLENQNTILQTQQVELKERNTEIEKQRNDITASISYAKRIQTAILPEIERIKQILPHSFVLYKPRDIVSGDFYYFATLQEASVRQHDRSRLLTNKIIIAAVDCTGHGVPGAFMSMIGDAMLNQIINIQRISTPDIILNELHKGVRLMLKQQEGENRDGMDIAICTIDLDARVMEFSGARNSLYLIQNNELKEIKADKLSIGGYQQEDERIFQKNIIDLSVPTTFYLTSDGYKDQFGSEEGKKFSARRFKELILSMQHLDMDAQAKLLDDTFLAWCGKEPQIDDVLVMGVKIDWEITP